MEMRELLSIYLPRKDLGILVCSESDCESPRKYLFKDLDGRALGLPPPVSVFPKIEAEWTGSFFNTGQFCLNSMSPVEGTSMGRSWFGCVVQWEQNILERNWAIELESVPVSCSTHLYLRNVGCLRDVTIPLFCPPWDCLWSMSKVQTPNTHLCTGEENGPLTRLVSWAWSSTLCAQRFAVSALEAVPLDSESFSSTRAKGPHSGKGGRLDSMPSFCLPFLHLLIVPGGYDQNPFLFFLLLQAHRAISFYSWTPGEIIVFLLLQTTQLWVYIFVQVETAASTSKELSQLSSYFIGWLFSDFFSSLPFSFEVLNIPGLSSLPILLLSPKLKYHLLRMNLYLQPRLHPEL